MLNLAFLEHGVNEHTCRYRYICKFLHANRRFVEVVFSEVFFSPEISRLLKRIVTELQFKAQIKSSFHRYRRSCKVIRSNRGAQRIPCPNKTGGPFTDQIISAAILLNCIKIFIYWSCWQVRVHGIANFFVPACVQWHSVKK